MLSSKIQIPCILDFEITCMFSSAWRGLLCYLLLQYTSYIAFYLLDNMTGMCITKEVNICANLVALNRGGGHL